MLATPALSQTALHSESTETSESFTRATFPRFVRFVCLAIFLFYAQCVSPFPGFLPIPRIYYTCSVMTWLPFKLALGAAVFSSSILTISVRLLKKLGDKNSLAY